MADYSSWFYSDWAGWGKETGSSCLLVVFICLMPCLKQKAVLGSEFRSPKNCGLFSYSWFSNFYWFVFIQFNQYFIFHQIITFLVYKKIFSYFLLCLCVSFTFRSLKLCLRGPKLDPKWNFKHPTSNPFPFHSQMFFSQVLQVSIIFIIELILYIFIFY